MIYKFFVGFDTGGEPIYGWKCDCEECQRTTANSCRHIIEAIEQEEGRRKVNERRVGSSMVEHSAVDGRIYGSSPFRPF